MPRFLRVSWPLASRRGGEKGTRSETGRRGFDSGDGDGAGGEGGWIIRHGGGRGNIHVCCIEEIRAHKVAAVKWWRQVRVVVPPAMWTSQAELHAEAPPWAASSVSALTKPASCSLSLTVVAERKRVRCRVDRSRREPGDAGRSHLGITAGFSHDLDSCGKADGTPPSWASKPRANSATMQRDAAVGASSARCEGAPGIAQEAPARLGAQRRSRSVGAAKGSALPHNAPPTALPVRQRSFIDTQKSKPEALQRSNENPIDNSETYDFYYIWWYCPGALQFHSA
ncbi:hypothetical protein BJV78DRAFT_1328840 [Lactifluus subvellereus]|nr:hypothetical protein BJV78DRAFT_1328840 [Lactifluus subvellereus]